MYHHLFFTILLITFIFFNLFLSHYKSYNTFIFSGYHIVSWVCMEYFSYSFIHSHSQLGIQAQKVQGSWFEFWAYMCLYIGFKLYIVCVREGQNHFCRELLFQVCQPLLKNLFTQKKLVGERWKGREGDSTKVLWLDQRKSN